MNKVSKIALASSLVFGTTIGANALASQNVQNEAHAAQTPYYNYTGYTSASSNFILDKNFKNAIKYDNLKINGYKISKGDSNTSKMVDKYDQSFRVVGENKADSVTFDLDGKSVSKEALFNAYGQAKASPTDSPAGLNYIYNIGGKKVQFYLNDGYVTKVQINS
ncbi:hypothetical protein ISO99_03405 [Staphylococcus sp. 18_1_E_LY]|uniref:Immunodominant staphylococcal antigen B n=1 Tax=Staphylococcus lloydii TaxID=2781774 RepID=A0A7T1F8N7_9STAP|nr:hypothetical protein [Staphylococcus lloydii]MBF7018951.1 hypothetical protein [Staphylococcus lloydii]MBF7026679.1 hypothetical protein [Staphylococcus lloydii]QPM74340.1 hypothetical protein ISP08_08265 [Staphylococcus lloydii]